MTHRPAPRGETPDYLTNDRLEIQHLARDFAMSDMLPLANHLDPARENFPDTLREKMGFWHKFRE